MSASTASTAGAVTGYSAKKAGLMPLGLRVCCRSCVNLCLSAEGVFYCGVGFDLPPLTRHQAKPCRGFTPPRIEPHETEKRAARLDRLAQIDAARAGRHLG